MVGMRKSLSFLLFEFGLIGLIGLTKEGVVFMFLRRGRESGGHVRKLKSRGGFLFYPMRLSLPARLWVFSVRLATC